MVLCIQVGIYLRGYFSLAPPGVNNPGSAKHKITAPLYYIREDPTLNTRLFGYAQKDQRKDVFEAVWWQKE